MHPSSLFRFMAFAIALTWETSFTLRAQEQTPPTSELIQIVFSSLRDRPAFASLYVYVHDGVSSGRVLGSLAQDTDCSYTNGCLDSAGVLGLCTVKQVGGFVPRLRLFQVEQRQFVETLNLRRDIASITHAQLSGNGQYIALCAWQQEGQPGGWDVFLFDRSSAKWVDLPGMNTSEDEREITISGDGRFLAYVAQRPDGAGLSDIYVYDRQQARHIPTPGLNSAQRDLNPAFSADGKHLAFVSDRNDGCGGKDVYVYHLDQGRLESLPLANSSAHEQSPTLSRDGGYLAYVSERIRGEGERDIYLYDTHRNMLLPTPGLNSRAEDFDPCISAAPPRRTGFQPVILRRRCLPYPRCIGSC